MDTPVAAAAPVSQAVTGEDFDPLAAIYDPNFELEAEGPLYDNVEACVAALSGTSKKNAQKKGGDESTGAVVEPRLERRFLPEQMPVTRQRAPFKHILARMSDFSQGPLGRLRQLHEERVKIKVNFFISRHTGTISRPPVYRTVCQVWYLP